MKTLHTELDSSPDDDAFLTELERAGVKPRGHQRAILRTMRAGPKPARRLD